MKHTYLVTTALIAIALVAAPMIGSADEQPLPVDEDGKAVVAAQGNDASKGNSNSVSSKRARASERAEGVDCFFEENKAEQDCRDSKSATR